MRGSILAMACLFAFHPASAQAPPQPASVSPTTVSPTVTRLANEFLADKPYASLSIGVIDGDKQVSQGFGEVELNGNKQVPDQRTLYEIGSITKTFTGTLLADLARDGLLNIDDPANLHLPESLQVPRYQDQEVRLIHLATHRSSLPVQPPLIGLFALMKLSPSNPYKHYKESNLAITLENEIRLRRKIGSKFTYSNLGVGLLGRALVESAKADSYEALLTERILEPLGMRDTCIAIDDAAQSRLAPGHSAFGREVSGWDFVALEGCGAIRSNVADMLRYAAANLHEGESPLIASIKDAQQERVAGDEDTAAMGLCWFILTLPEVDGRVYFHNGGTGGYRSFLALIPTRKVAVVVLCNSTKSVDELGFEILKSVAAVAN